MLTDFVVSEVGKKAGGWKCENLPHWGGMSNPEAEKRSPSRGTKHICVPFASEAQYQECVADVATYRTYLTREFQQHPELFPQAMGDGYTFHDRYRSRKQGVVLRRIKLKATAEVFTVRPSFLMPYRIARTAEVEKALYLRQWGVPFDGAGLGLRARCHVLVSGLARVRAAQPGRHDRQAQRDDAPGFGGG